MIAAALHRAILRGASVLVPAARRAEWLAEWRSELWHVRRDPRGANITAFCLGAFGDAFWLWRDGSCGESDWMFAESPARCLGWLAGLGTLCVAAGLLLPAARTVLLGSLYPRDLVLVIPGGADGTEMANGFIGLYPSVSAEQFGSLKAYGVAEFSGLAFYVPAPRARGHIIGDRLWDLPGSAEGWLIENEAAMAGLPARTKGFAVGRLRHGAEGKSPLRFIRLADRCIELLGVVPAIFLFACILFRIMTAGFRTGQARRIGLRKGLLLGVKALLVLPIVMFGSLDLGSFGATVSPVFLDIAFFGSLLGARWMFTDQRKRCPVCLRLLANPVRIGESSRILLEWHGTELMCPRGHGMLYVPEWPAIWSGRQRWMGLGASWGGMFL